MQKMLTFVKFNLLLTFYLIILRLQTIAAYKPVIILHGILSGAESMTILVREIEKQHPGTKVYNCDKFSGWNSLENAWRQVKEIRNYVETITKLHDDEGVIIIGYSQGGLLARAIIQTLPNHNIKTFISLSSPQAGQYGGTFLHLIFPDLVAKTAYELFYNNVGQHTSVGNYWNDPNKHELYLKNSVFLPYINNEVISTNSSSFKSAITRLEKLVLIGGPQDGIITPWQSSHFAYYNSSLDVVPLKKQAIYVNDTIGLKEMEESGKLVIVIRPFVHHLTWHTNRRVIREVILPYLD